jgi:hypothetical protein
VILSVVKTISYKHVLSTMARRRILRDEDIESELICDTDSDEYFEDSLSEEDEDDFADEQQPPPPIQQQRQNTKWGLQSQANQPHVHQYAGGDRGKKHNEAPHINKDSSPLSVFMLYFACY